MTSGFKFIYSSQKLELQNTDLFTEKMSVTWVSGSTGSAPGAQLHGHLCLDVLSPGMPGQRAGPGTGLQRPSVGTVGEPRAAAGLRFVLDTAHWDLFGQGNGSFSRMLKSRFKREHFQPGNRSAVPPAPALAGCARASHPAPSIQAVSPALLLSLSAVTRFGNESSETSSWRFQDTFFHLSLSP